MEKIDAFNLIQLHLLDWIEKYHKTKNINDMPQESRMALKAVWEKAIMPTSIMNLSCPTCIKHGLDVTKSWYDREYLKYSKAQEPIQQPKQKRRRKK